MPGALSFRYARALADAAAAPDARVDAQTITGELVRFEELLHQSPELKTALDSPAVPPPRKRAVVARLARELPLSDLVRRFLFVLIDHRRASLLAETREAFEAVMDERLGIARADVVSARPLSEQEQRQMIAGIARLTGKQARARFRVDESLTGGVMARVGSTVYDGSVRGQLNVLRRRLAGVRE